VKVYLIRLLDLLDDRQLELALEFVRGLLKL